MIQPRPTYRGRTPRARWTALDWTASLAISAFWHLLVLAVLALAVHPFQLPDHSQAVELELLPPLTTPPLPTVEVQLRPRQDEPRPARPLPRLRPAPPEAQPQPKAAEPPTQAQPETPPIPQEVARPTQPQLANPVEVQKRPVQAPRLQTQQAAPQITENPPQPVTVSKQTPVLAPPIEAPKAEAQRRAGPLNANRAAPQIQAPSAEAEAPVAPSTQVLTNSSVVQAPVEIRPRPAAPSAGARLNGQAATPEIATPSGGAQGQGGPVEGGGQASGGQASGSRLPPGGLKGFDGINGGLGLRGLRGGLDCDRPGMTTEEHNACLQQLGARARGAPDMSLANISAGKRAAFDRSASCHARIQKESIPNSAGGSAGTSIAGLGSAPSLKECPPGDR